MKPANPPAPARIYQDARRLEPGLAIARALGDCGANDFGVIATPEVRGTDSSKKPARILARTCVDPETYSRIAFRVPIADAR